MLAQLRISSRPFPPSSTTIPDSRSSSEPLLPGATGGTIQSWCPSTTAIPVGALLLLSDPTVLFRPTLPLLVALLLALALLVGMNLRLLAPPLVVIHHFRQALIHPAQGARLARLLPSAHQPKPTGLRTGTTDRAAVRNPRSSLCPLQQSAVHCTTGSRSWLQTRLSSQSKRHAAS